MVRVIAGRGVWFSNVGLVVGEFEDALRMDGKGGG